MPSEKSFILLLVIPVAFLLAACSGSRPVDSPEAGRTMTYDEAVPGFDIETVATLREDTTGIDVYVSLLPSSLVFRREGTGFESGFTIYYRLLDERGRNIIVEDRESEVMTSESFEDTRQVDPILLSHRFVRDEPGRYTVEVRVEDQDSGAASERRQRIEIPSPDADTAFLSRIRLEAQQYGGTGFEPVLAMHVSEDIDSLRAVVEVNRYVERELISRMNLVALRSDTSVAEPPHRGTGRFGLIGERGIVYHSGDTLQQVERNIGPVGIEPVVVEFALPPLSQGVYRLTISSSGADGSESLVEEDRLFSIKAAGYPEVTTLAEMIEALTYIATPEEMRELRSAGTPEEKRGAFDAFWGSLFPDPQVAQNVMVRYYGRIEEANRMYATYKEGWKTDRGMLYVILGPPVWVDRDMGMERSREVWHYPESSSGAIAIGNSPSMEQQHYFRDNIFHFQIYTPAQFDRPFSHADLNRHPNYRISWQAAIDRWREGRAY